MGKEKKIIIILLILIVLLVLVYFLIFNKSYTLTVYKYQINNQENIGKTMPKDATLIEQYDVKCNKKCELITYDYDKTFFVVKNKEVIEFISKVLYFIPYIIFRLKRR